LHPSLPKDRVSVVADSSIDRACEMLKDVSAVALTREDLACLAPGFSPSGPGIPVLLRGIAEDYLDGEERKAAGRDQLEVHCVGDAVLVTWLGYRKGDRPPRIAPVIAWLPAVPKDSDVYVQSSYVYHAFKGGDPT
jgi:hypothetical protein